MATMLARIPCNYIEWSQYLPLYRLIGGTGGACTRLPGGSRLGCSARTPELGVQLGGGGRARRIPGTEDTAGVSKMFPLLELATIGPPDWRVGTT